MDNSSATIKPNKEMEATPGCMSTRRRFHFFVDEPARHAGETTCWQRKKANYAAFFFLDFFIAFFAVPLLAAFGAAAGLAVA